MSLTKLSLIVKSGSLEHLTQEEQQYFSLMEMVRGLRVRNSFQGKIVTKAGIIKLLKNEYHCTDFQARQLYTDSINFFYAQEHIQPEAFRNLYAEKLDNAAALALQTGDLEMFSKLTMEAAKLRGCFEKSAPEIPQAAYQRPTVIYTVKSEDIGIARKDMKEVAEFIDALPDVPYKIKERVKAEAGIPNSKYDIMKIMAEDAEFYGEETDNK